MAGGVYGQISGDREHYGIMTSTEDEEDLDEVVEQYDTTWSWVK